MHPEGLEISRSAIKDPMKYRDICASRALTVSGEEKSVETLLAEIEKDIPFYREDGGVTLSGGEPLSQGNDLEVLLQALKNRNIDVAVETSLYVPWDKVERCLGLVGTFLADLKHTNREKFSAYVKGDADIVLKNLEKLDSMKENIIIRIPVVAGFNHTIHEMRDIIDFATTLNTVSEIHFLPYHTLGTEKYNMLGMEYTYSGKQPFEAELTEYIDYAHTKGFNVKIGG
jgi:pyruvate formate lyase activating enzyme